MTNISKMKDLFNNLHININSKADLDEYISENKLVLLDFYATWCSPCMKFGKMIEKNIETINKQFPDLKFAKINVDDNNALAEKYNISGIPRLILLKNGKSVYDNEGYLDLKDFLNVIEKAIK